MAAVTNGPAAGIATTSAAGREGEVDTSGRPHWVLYNHDLSRVCPSKPVTVGKMEHSFLRKVFTNHDHHHHRHRHRHRHHHHHHHPVSRSNPIDPVILPRFSCKIWHPRIVLICPTLWRRRSIFQWTKTEEPRTALPQSAG